MRLLISPRPWGSTLRAAAPFGAAFNFLLFCKNCRRYAPRNDNTALLERYFLYVLRQNPECPVIGRSEKSLVVLQAYGHHVAVLHRHLKVVLVVAAGAGGGYLLYLLERYGHGTFAAGAYEEDIALP